jgi:cytosine/adenosine deaminase-related metal-dependent hydrolase
MKGQTGRIAAGQRADLVLVRADDAGTIAADPSVGALVQHAGAENVDAVMVDGRWVLRDGRILAFDEDAVRRDAAEQSTLLRERVAADLPAVRAAIPGVAARPLRVCG